MRHRASLILTALLAGCTASIDDLRQEPIRWSARYNVAFDTMANCLAARMAQHYAVTPQIYQREGRAVVTMVNRAASSMVSEFVVTKIDDSASMVEWRRRKVIVDLGGLVAHAHEAAEICAKS